MTPLKLLIAAALALSLSACADSISAPTAVQPLSAPSAASLHVSDITADAATGVEMSEGDFGLICQKVRGYIQSQTPGVLAAGDGTPLKMRLHFTKFDRGNAFARMMLAGLGQIRIEATVQFTDAAGAPAGTYTVAKDFSFGGMYGGSVTVEDVEDGFAKSVAEIFKPKA